jgi:hypothetical protein
MQPLCFTGFNKQLIIENYKKPSSARILLVSGIGIVTLAVILGFIGSSSWNIKQSILFVLSIVSFGIISTAPEHFLKEHIWKHIVKKHIGSVLLWSFSAIIFVELGFEYWNIEEFVQQHMELVGLIAVLLAIVPESGPHMIFVMLYARGLIPFSILLASSFVQKGDINMITFGPVPSRRLGRSLGINNIPPKFYSYSCVYCQVGRTLNMQMERKAFYEPERILKEVKDKVKNCRNYQCFSYLARGC